VDHAVSQHRIYRFTSVGRPLDPAVPTNRAVLILMPLAAGVGVAWSLAGGASGWAAVQQGLVFLLAVFGAWALARELLPDLPAVAFVSLALAFLACLATPSPGLLTLFATLGLVRIVNRSTGLAARVPDSVAVTALVIWTVYRTGNPWFGAVGAYAFLLDASLRKPLKRQLPFALVCVGAMVVYIVDHDVNWLQVKVPDNLLEWLGVFALVLFSLNLVLMRKVHSKGDVGATRLDLERVKGGMSVGLLATLQGIDEWAEVVLLVATIGGLCLGIAFRRAFRPSSKGLRAG
jgi:hypothetical protein